MATVKGGRSETREERAETGCGGEADGDAEKDKGKDRVGY